MREDVGVKVRFDQQTCYRIYVQIVIGFINILSQVEQKITFFPAYLNML